MENKRVLRILLIMVLSAALLILAMVGCKKQEADPKGTKASYKPVEAPVIMSGSSKDTTAATAAAKTEETETSSETIAPSETSDAPTTTTNEETTTIVPEETTSVSYNIEPPNEEGDIIVTEPSSTKYGNYRDNPDYYGNDPHFLELSLDYYYNSIDFPKDPWPEPTPNTMTQADLKEETYYDEKGRYHVYPIPHEAPAPIPKIGIPHVTTGDYYPAQPYLVVVRDGKIKINVVVDDIFGEFEPYETTINVVGVEGYTGGGEKGESGNVVILNHLRGIVLMTGHYDAPTIWLEPAEVLYDEEGDMNCYVWIEINEGVYGQLEEYLLANGYVQPSEETEMIRYQDYYKQYPELYRFWEDQ